MAGLDVQSQHFLLQLHEQNQDVLCLQRIFQQYQNLLFQNRQQKTNIDEMALQTSALRTEKLILEEESKAFKSSGAIHETQQARIQELEAKVRVLEGELKGSYKSIQDNDSAFIKLHNEAGALRDQVDSLKKAESRLTNQLSDARQNIKQLEEEAKTLKVCPLPCAFLRVCPATLSPGMPC